MTCLFSLTGIWSCCPALSQRRRYCKLAAMDNCVWAVGGLDASSAISNVERLDPREGNKLIPFPVNLLSLAVMPKIPPAFFYSTALRIHFVYNFHRKKILLLMFLTSKMHHCRWHSVFIVFCHFYDFPLLSLFCV